MNRKMLVRSSWTWARLWRWIGLLLVAVLLVSGNPVGAGEPEPAELPIPMLDRLIVEETAGRPAGFNPKLDSALNQLLEVQRTEGMAGVRDFAGARQMVLDGDRVQVILVTQPETLPGLAQAAEALGGQIQGDYEGLLQALLPLDALQSLAARSDVQRIREPQRAIELESPQAGSVTTEGAAASNATAWHAAGYDGTGVRTAVVDGGFAGYSTLLGSDLPASVGTYDWTGLGMGGSEHGTACAEIAHDMAPGATMDLHKVSTVVDLNQAVTQAIADGVDVISLSGGWILDGPGDGTGPLADIVSTARSNGIFWSNAAGNEAEVTWAGTYDDYYLADNDMHLHAWDGTDLWYNFMGPGTGTCYVFPAGTAIRAGLHWDDWSAVDQDYDLHLARWPGSGGLILVASSTEPQNGGVGQTPQEFISYTAAGGNCYAWIVERVNSTRDVCFRLSAPNTVHLDQWTPARSVTFPADSPDAITVAAVDVTSPYPLEPYSSHGPTFGPGGACSGGAVKPDIASYDNVSTVTYGAGAFAGTSAATPHVAGAAALVKQRYPGYSVAQLQSYLESEALDLGTAGKDTLYGSGRLYLPANTPPILAGLPDQALLVNTSHDNAIDLWAYAEDAEDNDPDLLFTISNSPDASAGVTIDANRYIDINPALDWTGTTDVEIQVEDTGGLTDTDTFRVRVTSTPPPEHWVYLSIVLKNYLKVPQPPSAPDLDSIDNTDGDGNYTVCWSAVSGATSYTLEEDDNPGFTSPETRYAGLDTCVEITGKPPGTYFYRVKASNAAGDSGWSDVELVIVLEAPPSDWTYLSTGITQNLNSVHFVDTQTGWAVGDDGAIFHTADAGETWQPQNSGTGDDLSDVFFLDANRGWAVGGQGLILRTTDGGDIWTTQPSPNTTYLESIYFADEEHGWIGGGHYTVSGPPWVFRAYGYVYATVDSGDTWILARYISSRYVLDLHFVDSLHGWLITEHIDNSTYATIPRVYVTSDGGLTWVNQPIPLSTGELNAITFADVNTGWAVGNDGVVLHTANGGSVWSPQASTVAKDLYDVAFTSSTTGWFVDPVRHTTNGGQTWGTQTLDPECTGLHHLTFLDADHGWAVGTNGTVCRY